MPNITIDTYEHGLLRVLDEQGESVTRLEAGATGVIEGMADDGWEFVEFNVDGEIVWPPVFTMMDSDITVSGALAQSETVEIDLDQVYEATVNTQYFWTDDDGAHVTEMPQEDWIDARDEGFPDISDSNPYSNSLWTSLAMLFRTGVSNIVSIGRSAVAFFDGLGNAPKNVIAMFGRDMARVGNSGSMHTDISAGSISMLNGTDRLMRIGGDLTGRTKPYHVYGMSQLDREAYYIGMSVVEGEEVYQMPSEPAYAYVDAPMDEPAPELWVRSDYADDPTEFVRIDDLEEMMGSSFADIYRYETQVMEGGSVNRHVYWFSHVNGASEEAVTDWQIRSTYPERLPMTAIGEGCVAASPNQVVLGRYNVVDTQNRYTLIVGNGTDDSHRSNALTLDWSGNLSISGSM